MSDLRYALRALRANPGITAVIVLSLAVGIGPNVAIFSIVDGLGFRPLPVRNPARLLQVSAAAEGQPGEVSYPEFLEIRDRARLLTDVIASGRLVLNFGSDGQLPEVVFGAFVSADYFDRLGVRPALGRSFLPEEDRSPGAHMVAMISERLWKQRFASAPDIIGKAVRLTRQTCTIVGVVPADFAGTVPVFAPEVWVPSMAWPALDRGVEATLHARALRSVTVLARLAPGATIEAARAELDALGVHLGETAPPGAPAPAFVLEYEQSVRRRPVAMIAVLVLAAVSLVLLVACANVAGLMLGRAEWRAREIGVRVALGASRRRLVRQLLTESLVLAVLGAVAGAALAWCFVRLLPAFIPPTGLPLHLDFRVDRRILAFALAVALCAVPFFGLAPALLASRPDVVPLLKGRPPGEGRARLPLRRILVVSQIAVAVPLLVASVFLVQSYFRTRGIDPGFVKRPMVFTTVAPAAVNYTTAQLRDYYARLVERLAGFPGVERVTLARHLPLNSLYGVGPRVKVVVPGREVAPGAEPPGFRYNTVAPGYFETMGTPLLRGRDFNTADVDGGRGVVIVNETMAKQYWGMENAIGQQFVIEASAGASSRRTVQVVGVARNAKYITLTEAASPYLYVPLAQDTRGEVTLVVRCSGDPVAMVDRVRREVLALDPAVPVMQVLTLDQHLSFALAMERFVAVGMTALGSLGLGLSLVGLYGAISFVVARRTREVGVRIALGALPSRVVGQLVREGGRFALAGVLLGLAASVALMRVLSSGIYGIDPANPLVFAGTGVAVMIVALVASWIPARRAAAVDPLVALRNE